MTKHTENSVNKVLSRYDELKTAGNLITMQLSKTNATLCSKCPVFGVNSRTDRGCCVDCASYSGHYRGREIPIRVLDALKTKYKFDEKYGFFNDSVKSCSLPRHLRSNTCLTYGVTNGCYRFMDSVGRSVRYQARHLIRYLLKRRKELNTNET